jgi:hypothetical protein
MSDVDTMLEVMSLPQAWFFSFSPWVSLAIVGVILAAMLTLAGFVLARLGYKPLWALLLLVPTLSVIALWVMAYLPFPREKLGINR